jgi:hypothetical protein
MHVCEPRQRVAALQIFKFRKIGQPILRLTGFRDTARQPFLLVHRESTYTRLRHDALITEQFAIDGSLLNRSAYDRRHILERWDRDHNLVRRGIVHSRCRDGSRYRPQNQTIEQLPFTARLEQLLVCENSA